MVVSDLLKSVVNNTAHVYIYSDSEKYNLKIEQLTRITNRYYSGYSVYYHCLKSVSDYFKNKSVSAFKININSDDILSLYILIK